MEFLLLSKILINNIINKRIALIPLHIKKWSSIEAINMKLIGCTICFNEEFLVPFVMPYVRLIDYDKFIIYDNHSTDKTVSLIQEYANKYRLPIEIRYFETNNTFDDLKHIEIHYEIFKECCNEINNSNEDIWLIFSDFDEIIYYNNPSIDLKDILSNAKGSYYNKNIIELISENAPILLSDVDLCHRYIRDFKFMPQPFGRKVSILHVNDIQFIKFYPGNHWIDAKFNCNDAISLNNIIGLYNFHLKYIDKSVFIEKTIRNFNRLGKITNEYMQDIRWKEITSLNFNLRQYLLNEEAKINNDNLLNLKRSPIEIIK